MAAPYPSEPFAQADDLLTGLIESYRSSSDAADMAYIQNVVDNVVKTAQDREFRVQDSIKGTRGCRQGTRLVTSSNMPLFESSKSCHVLLHCRADSEGCQR